MLQGLSKQVIAGLISLIIASLAIVAWEWVTDGGLIKSLGGAIVSDLKQQCTAHPVEEFQSYVQCGDGEYELLKWCSGDCNSDDARMTICCKE